MEVSGARYQVGGPNAFNAHGFDDQVPNLTYVYNDRLSGARTVGGCHLVFIKVAGARLGGTVEPPAGGDAGVPMTDIARTLVDAVRDWSRFDTLPRAYRWVRQVVTRDGALAPRLADYVRRYGNVATGRRLGYLLERLDADPTALEKLRGYVGAAKSVIPWIPRRRASGPISPWGVIVNGEVPDA
jgi:predicted transcriptional regulator of viral defense system